MTKNKKKKRNRYTEQFRAEALRVAENRGSRTLGEVAEGLGIAEHLLHSWRSKTKTDGEPNDRGETMEQELRRLRRELSDVKKDRDILVKSIAVFVRERK